jgi:hypothetical protein
MHERDEKPYEKEETKVSACQNKPAYATNKITP